MDDESAWEGYDDPDQPTAAVDTLGWDPGHRRFPAALHGYDREAVDAHIAALERELADMQAQRASTLTATIGTWSGIGNAFA